MLQNIGCSACSTRQIPHQGLMFVTKNYGWKCFTGHLKDMQRNFRKPKLKIVAVIYCVRLNDRKLKTTIE